VTHRRVATELALIALIRYVAEIAADFPFTPTSPDAQQLRPHNATGHRSSTT
jgi:hypothetical protein